MSATGPKIAITGAGAVSPAGWDLPALVRALQTGAELPTERFAGAPRAQRRRVPKPAEKLPFLRNPRLRRSSPVGKYLAAAALEAIENSAVKQTDVADSRLAVIVSSYTGCVNYSSRFYREVLADAATASPIIFPETVFNAPSSHLSALLESDEVNHTIVGDESAFASAIDLAARWLIDDKADRVLVAAGEESDPLTAEALALYEREPIVGEGAGALLLERSESPRIELAEVIDPITYTNRTTKSEAVSRIDQSDAAHHPQRCIEVFGDTFGATPALATVACYATLAAGESATIPIIGKNQAAAQLTLRRLEPGA